MSCLTGHAAESPDCAPSQVPGDGSYEYAALFQHLPSAFALHEMVFQGERAVDYVFREVNLAFERMTGLSRGEIVGKRVTEVIPGIETDPAGWIDRYAEVVRTGEPLKLERHAVHLNRWYRVTAYRSRPGHFCAIFDDISERKLGEERLARSEDQSRLQSRRLSALLEATHAQLALLDRHMTFVTVNSAYEQGCGHKKEALLGRNHFDLFPSEDNERIFRGVVQTGEPHFVEEKPFEFRDQPGRGTTWWNWSLVPIVSGGEVEGVLLSLMDVTCQVRARHQAEKLAAELELALGEARREAELRERFMAILGHDLRNPLTSVMTTASALLRRGELEERSFRGVQRIWQSSERMNRMIADLLDFTRCRVGMMPIEPQLSELEEIGQKALEEVRSAHPERSIELLVEGPCRGVWDPERLAQVFSNLVSNALQHGSPHAPVVVKLRGGPDTVALSVENQGPPINADALATIFEPFRQGARDGCGKGLGLGLYVVREIVKAHGGRVEVRSTEEEGTCFSVHLPRAARSDGGAAK